MTLQVPTTEPNALRVGDTWNWTKSFSDFPASQGWSLTYYLKKDDADLTIAASTYLTDGFQVYVPPGTTSGYRPGRYKYHARITNGTDSYSVSEGELIVRPDPSVAGAVDARTHAKKVIEALKALALRRAGGRQHVSVDGVSMYFDTQADVIKAISYWRGVLEMEENAYRIKKGLGSKRTIRTRMGRRGFFGFCG